MAVTITIIASIIAFFGAAGGVCGYVEGKARVRSDADWKRTTRKQGETISRLLERD